MGSVDSNDPRNEGKCRDLVCLIKDFTDKSIFLLLKTLI
jgi:hypothetical protein